MAAAVFAGEQLGSLLQQRGAVGDFLLVQGQLQVSGSGVHRGIPSGFEGTTPKASVYSLVSRCFLRFSELIIWTFSSRSGVLGVGKFLRPVYLGRVVSMLGADGLATIVEGRVMTAVRAVPLEGRTKQSGL